jgi:hypothetical protein
VRGRLDLTGELRVIGLVVHAELALVALDLLAAALCLLVLRAGILHAGAAALVLTDGDRLGRRRLDHRALQAEARRVFLGVGELERLLARVGRHQRANQSERAEVEDGAAKDGEHREELGAPERRHGDRLRRVLEEDRELAVLDEAVVAGHDGHRRTRAREGHGILAASAQREEPAHAAACVELPAALPALERCGRHLDAVGDRKVGCDAVTEDERLTTRERAERDDGGAPDRGDTESIRRERLSLGHRP